MPVGALSWWIELDNPSMIHCGPSNPITGHVVLRYTASTSQELFGPMQLTVTLDGRAKTKIWKQRGETTVIYRGRAPLIHVPINIHDGPLQLATGSQQKYPFTIDIPSSVDQTITQAKWQQDPEFDTSPSAPLPPSFSSNYHGFVHRFKCFCDYRVNALVSMRQIDVKILPAGSEDGETIHYQPTRVALPTQPTNVPLVLRETVVTQNKYLLPEEQRPSGFVQHAKNFFGGDAYPTFVYGVVLEAVTDIFLNQPLRFRLSLRPDLDRSTAPEMPVMKMLSFQVHLKADTHVRAESLLYEQHSRGRETIATFLGKALEPGDFSKANDYTKTVETTTALVGLPSTFSTFTISRTYTMVLSLSIQAANKTQSIKREFRVNVLPPTNAGIEAVTAEPSQVEAGPSSGGGGGDRLPEYQAHQAPPTYEDIKAK